MTAPAIALIVPVSNSASEHDSTKAFIIPVVCGMVS
jgi:hypothetical protein